MQSRRQQRKSKNHSVMYHLQGIYFSYLNTRSADRRFKNVHDEKDVLSVYKRMMIFSYIISPVIFCAFTSLFGWLIGATGQSIDAVVVVFLIFVVMQSGLWYFTIFFENKDRDIFMALPISQEEIFRSKWISAGLSSFLVLVGVLPVICFFIEFRGFGLWGIPLGFLVFAVILMLTINLCVIAIHLGPVNQFVMKHLAKLRTIVSLAFTGFAVFFGIISQKFTRGPEEGQVVHFGPLSKLLSTLPGILCFIVVGTILVIGLEIYITKKYALSYYDRASAISDAQKKKSNETYMDKASKNEKKSRNHGDAAPTNSFLSPKGSSQSREVVNILAKNTLATMKEESSLMQQTVSSIILPVFMIPSIWQFGIKDVLGKNFIIDLTFCLIFSVFMVLFTYGLSTTFPSILVSIDGKTFESIKALPLNLRLYLMSRLKILAKVFMPLPFVVNIGALVFFGASIKAIAIAALVYLVLSILVAISKILSDFLNPFLDWTNLNQLYMRDGKLKPVFISLVIIGVFMTSMGVFNFLVEKGLITWLLGFGVVLTLVLAATAFLKIYWKLSKINAN